jgi:hypothetical protein
VQRRVEGLCGARSAGELQASPAQAVRVHLGGTRCKHLTLHNLALGWGSPGDHFHLIPLSLLHPFWPNFHETRQFIAQETCSVAEHPICCVLPHPACPCLRRSPTHVPMQLPQCAWLQCQLRSAHTKGAMATEVRKSAHRTDCCRLGAHSLILQIAGCPEPLSSPPLESDHQHPPTSLFMMLTPLSFPACQIAPHYLLS